jgi:colanic acid biosynthesis glycosyl transferase WcaI
MLPEQTTAAATTAVRSSAGRTASHRGTGPREDRARHVLLVTQWYAPEPVTRQLRLAEGLVARGFVVTVVTAFPSYPLGRTYPDVRQRPRDIAGTQPRVIRVPSVPSRSMSLLHRGVSYASFALSAAVLGLPAVRKADIVWAYQPPPSVAIPALLAKRRFRAPLVHEIQDMWPDTLVASGLRPEGRLTVAIERAMRWILRRADAVVVISQGFARMLEERGTGRERITVIPNWASVALQAQPTASGRPAGFRLLYAGNVGPGQRLDFVVAAIAAANRHLPEPRAIALSVLGDGPALPAVIEAAEVHGVRVDLLPRVPPEQVAGVAVDHDALLVNLADDPAFRSTVPSKLITYLALGKPVLAGLAGDGADIVRRADAGIAFEPEDLDAAVTALTGLARASDDELARMAANARAAYDAEFDAERLLDRYEQLFTTLIDQNRSAQPPRGAARPRLRRSGVRSRRLRGRRAR